MMKRIVQMLCCCLACVLLVAPPVTADCDDTTIHLGVLAFRSIAETRERWQPLADYLGYALDGRPVELVVADYPDLEGIIARNEVDFVLTNPNHYIELRVGNLLSGALATMIVEEQGYAVTGFGGVIVVSGDRDDLTKLSDLKGKTIAAVSESSLGGYRAQAMALRQQGVRLPQDSKIRFTGMPHDNAVLAVLDGSADAGFARTGVIEEMIAEGRIDPTQIRVLEQRELPGFPFALSTRLYPEWPFVALSQADSEVARRVAAALYLFEPDATTAAQMGLVGFGIPADYESVEALARELRLPPYDQLPVFGIAEVWGQYRWFIVVAMIAMLTMAGLVMLAVLINRRLSSAKNLLSVERTRLAGIIAGTGVGTWEWNVQTGETTFNERWAEVVGYSLAELEPISIATWMQFAHPDDLKKSEELLQQHFRGERDYYECECRMRHRDGSWVWVLDRGRVISRTRTGEPLLMMGTHLDISARKNAALILEQKNAEMEEFVYIVSHDLKSPLVTMKSFLSVLREDMAADNQELVHEDINYIEGAAAKMDQLLEALLEYSRVGRSAQPPTLLRVDEIVNDCLDTLAGALRKKQIDIQKTAVDIQLYGDQLRLGQIWQNLVENAIKYMGDQAQPRIEIGVSDSDDGPVFYVRDNGMGIATEHQQHIFAIFAQLNSSAGGIGLGLALVKKIVESFSGRIWLESAGAGQGCCFFFTLPGAINHEAQIDLAS